jgi:UDP-glucose 4-epimerase
MELIRYFVSGGAGFIGSSLIHRLLKNEQDIEIVCYDNLSVGKLEYLNDIKNDPRLKIFIANIQDTRFLVKCMNGCDIIYHFASNSDISKAMTEPSIDFYEGTLLTFYILEAMRINKVKRIIYASGSGVYGFTGLFKNTENETLQPASPYGASKMAGEGLISAYCHLFNMQGAAYRFANVIGKNSTHGVIKDFIEKLKNNKHLWKSLLKY